MKKSTRLPISFVRSTHESGSELTANVPSLGPVNLVLDYIFLDNVRNLKRKGKGAALFIEGMIDFHTDHLRLRLLYTEKMKSSMSKFEQREDDDRYIHDVTD